MCTIICCGDSNTFGYDPSDPLGNPFDCCWCSLLAKMTGSEVVNLGENGRTVPTVKWEYLPLLHELTRHPEALLIVMLGTNDILMGRKPDTICRRMISFLSEIRQAQPNQKIVLLSPPQIALPGFDVSEAAEAYAAAANTLAIPVLHPKDWNIPLAFDGIHFSEEGHERFAHILFDELWKLT